MSTLHKSWRESIGAPKQALGTIQLAAIMFMIVCCGAYATEEMIAAVGPLPSIIVLIVLPIFWGIPAGLCFAELATTVPSNAGFIMWLNVTFPKWVTSSFVFFLVPSAWIDLAVFPVLFMAYLQQITGPLEMWASALIKLGVCIVAAVVNIVGVEIVGIAGMVFTGICLAPFIGLVIFGDWKTASHRWGDLVTHTPGVSMDWPTMLAVATWNFSSIDGVGHLAEEVRAPRKTLPRGLVLCMTMTGVSYLLPILVGVGTPPRNPLQPQVDYRSTWVEGYFVTVAGIVGGDFLKYLMLIGALCCALGIYVMLTCVYARALQMLGNIEFFPRMINRVYGHLNKRWCTPVNAILINTTVSYILCLFLDFDELIGFTISLYTLRLTFCYMSVVIMRFKYPNLHRPYKMPGNQYCAIAWVTFPILWCFGNFISSFFVGTVEEKNPDEQQSAGSPSWLNAVLASAVIVICLILGVVYSTYYRRNGFPGAIIRHKNKDGDWVETFDPDEYRFMYPDDEYSVAERKLLEEEGQEYGTHEVRPELKK